MYIFLFLQTVLSKYKFFEAEKCVPCWIRTSGRANSRGSALTNWANGANWPKRTRDTLSFFFFYSSFWVFYNVHIRKINHSLTLTRTIKSSFLLCGTVFLSFFPFILFHALFHLHGLIHLFSLMYMYINRSICYSQYGYTVAYYYIVL